MEFSQEFIAIVKEAALKCRGVAEFVSLRNIEWDKTEHYIYVTCNIRETKDGPECGHGMSLRFESFVDMCFYYTGMRHGVKTSDVWNDIKGVIPHLHDFFDYQKILIKRTKTLKEKRAKVIEQEEEIEYLKAKLIIIDYEKKQKEKEDDDNPF